MQCYIGDITHLSTSSWHGEVSTIIRFAGCDFHCPGCNTFPINHFDERFIRDTRDVQKEIRGHSKLNSAVIFSGGEPCLQREALFSLCKYCRSRGLRAGIETNGSKPAVIDSLLGSRLVEFIAIDLKSPLEPELFSRATKAGTFFTKSEDIIRSVKESISCIMEQKRARPGLEVEFRTTVVPGIIYKKEHLISIARVIERFGCAYRLQQFRPEFAGSMSSIKPPTDDFMHMLKESVSRACPGLVVIT